MDDILKQIEAGEVSGVQFKERALDKYDIGCELVAFSNARGGKLVVGVNDKTGKINALSYSEVQETTNLLSKEAKEFILEAEKHTALRAKPVCPAVFERNKMMEATQYESYFSS